MAEEIRFVGELTKGTDGAAAYDLYATENALIAPGKRAMVRTGVYLEMPDTMGALVLPRSGWASRNGITVLNTPGLIDSDYRGEIGVILVNHGEKHFAVTPGVRIAQLLFIHVPSVSLERVRVSDLVATLRGANGFGSTNVAE